MNLDLDVRVPSSGEPRRVDCAGIQILFERSMRGVRVVALESDPIWKAVLGLPETGVIRIAPRLPRHPLEWELESRVLLVPGGRVRGWLKVPVLLHLFWVEPGRDPLPLAVLPDASLKTGWREEGGYFHPWSAPLSEGPWGGRTLPSRRCWVRVVLEQSSEGGPEAFPIERLGLHFEGLSPKRLRGDLIGPCVRWTRGPGGGQRLRLLPEWGNGDLPQRPIRSAVRKEAAPR